MSVIIKDMEMPKTCSQCEIWSKCWDERPFWFERLEYCPLMEMADRTTEPTISKMEQVEEPQTKYPCDTCANKGDHDGECSNCVSSSETIKWKTPSHYKPKDEPQTDWNETLPCHKCESALSSECTACDGQQYFRTEEGETDCPWK